VATTSPPPKRSGIFLLRRSLGSSLSFITQIFKVSFQILLNSFYAVLDAIILSIKERFNENSINVIVLCEKLFLTNFFLMIIN
ncbi:unnamed protein product, partial [Rotaria sp. Silwood2]